MDVTITQSEIMNKLNQSGALRKAVLEIAEAKAGGQPVGNIHFRTGGEALSSSELKSVVGGAAATGTLNFNVLKSPTSPTIEASSLKAANTRW